MATVSQMNNRIQQLAPRGRVGVFVGNLTPRYITTEMDEAVAWRLVAARRAATLFGVAKARTGLQTVRDAKVFAFLIDDERLVSFQTSYCRDLNGACLHRIDVALDARYHAQRPTTG
jgi:hypothetical protein